MRRPFLFLLLLASASATAADFYVDPVAGSDDGDGSAANPWRSLQTVFDDGLIETRDWPDYPYDPGMQLVTVNAGAPVHAGDTLWLRAGFHGDIQIEHAYNTAPITIAAAAGQTPHVRSLTVQAAQNWIVRGLSISPSYAAVNESIGMVEVSDHNYFGPTFDIEVADCDVFSVDDASSWGADEWVNLASSGVGVGASRVSIHDNRLRNVRFGISVDGADASIRRNLIDGFSADGLRGLGDNGLFEYNTIQNNKIGDPDDGNHDDGFQSWSIGEDGQVGTGQVTGVTLRGNLFINATDPNDPLRSSMQGIGCFDGFFENWVVENNVVITDHWHGISFYGMRDSRIVNNSVIDLDEGQPGPPWIMVTDHKDGTPSENVIVRNNLATDFSFEGINI
ncbi:MAG: right-handed parallel beta-helix repeat-containing protein, partial [Rhodanobacteraceae bacterium]